MLLYKGTVDINTDRLLLRKFIVDDALQMFKNWANDGEVTKFMPWQPHSNIEETNKIVTQWVREYENNNSYNWGIEIKEKGELIGSISIVKLDENNHSCEVGYCMSKLYWGKGIMSETLNAVIGFLFSEVGFNRIEAKHDPQNVASGKVMIKCGMTYEGTSRQARGRHDGEYYDLANYAILKDDWINNRWR